MNTRDFLIASVDLLFVLLIVLLLAYLSVNTKEVQGIEPEKALLRFATTEKTGRSLNDFWGILLQSGDARLVVVRFRNQEVARAYRLSLQQLDSWLKSDRNVDLPIVVYSLNCHSERLGELVLRLVKHQRTSYIADICEQD